MSSTYQELLNRILASRHFANAESLRRVLQFLCERSEEGADVQLKEYEIAVGALGRPPSFDPRLDPIVRVNIASIRERLHAYYEGEGQGEAIRLDIPKGQYRASFVESASSARIKVGVEQRSPALEKFWKPYLAGRVENYLVFTELLFFRDDENNFIRSIYVNNLKTAREDLEQRFRGVDVGAYKPTFHFVSAGEMHACLALTRMFVEMGVRIEAKNSRFSSWNTLRQANLILIGSSRTNVFLDSLQGESCFVILADAIENRAPREGEERFYRGSRFTDGRLEKVTEYAVVTRRPGPAPGSTVTLVAANHGRANEGAVDFLTTEHRVQTLLDRLRLGEGQPLPASFQIIFRVDLLDFDEEVVQVDYVTHRVITE